MPSVVDVGLPDDAPVAFVARTSWSTEWPAIAVSPDGDFVVYVARRGDDTELWYRSLQTGEARALPGTRSAYQPVLSPDNRSAVFFAGGSYPCSRSRDIVQCVPRGLAGPFAMNDNLVVPSEAQQRAWMAQWNAARTALRAQRASELRALSNDAALAAADALLSIAALAPLSENRRMSSGLVHQQALFRRRPAP